jgi:hypothetical protein
VSPQAIDLPARMDRLATLAQQLLPSMLDARSGLFAQKTLWGAHGPQSVDTNALYSAMAAIGIHNDDAQGRMVSVRLDVTHDALVDLSLAAGSSMGLIAATTWALAAAGDERTGTVLNVIEHRFEPIRSSSMEIGLVLSALAAVVDTFPPLRDKAAGVAAPATQELIARFSGAARLFRGSSWAIRPRRLLEWNLTSFASQVYPIHGLAQCARAFETPAPQQIRDAADQLVAMQGPLGQWWWIYSIRTGAVLEAYPVYSVHQDAMAFMALASLEGLGFDSYRAELARGLAWIFGENELHTPMVDFDRGFMSRCIQRRGSDADGIFGMSPAQRRRVVLSSWRLRKQSDAALELNELEILHEARPYHLGWVLYARSLVKDW